MGLKDWTSTILTGTPKGYCAESDVLPDVTDCWLEAFVPIVAWRGRGAGLAGRWCDVAPVSTAERKMCEVWAKAKWK